jgi:hypothetical protein
MKRKNAQVVSTPDATLIGSIHAALAALTAKMEALEAAHKAAPKGPKAAPKGPKVKVFKATKDWSPTAAQRAYYLANKAKFKKDREAYLAAKAAGLVA